MYKQNLRTNNLLYLMHLRVMERGQEMRRIQNNEKSLNFMKQENK